MKCQSHFSGKNKKTMMPSSEFAHGEVNVRRVHAMSQGVSGTYEDSKNSAQHVHSRSLIRVT